MKNTIIVPFLKGKYSEIDRDYVTKYFKQQEFVGYDSWGYPQYRELINYKVLTKSPDLKEYWEKRLDVELDPDAEVWSRPEEENEILNYPITWKLGLVDNKVEGVFES